MLCAYLAGALFVGLLGNALLGAWWLDPAVALLIAAVPVKEGVEARRGRRLCLCQLAARGRTVCRRQLRRRLLLMAGIPSPFGRSLVHAHRS
ncbi:MAG: hypothetical protein J0H06_10955 [Actinobacteria bacterium]|nr:hypothetical protein [Actinomycetota bacterium]